jgi:predicted Rossmann fold flavoprotein
MLVTHRGLSGPAILQISSYWEKPRPVVIDLAPGREVTAAFRDPKVPRTVTALKAGLESILPNRLAARWADLHAPIAWTNAALSDFEKKLHAWQLMPAGTEGYEKAEVTAGGVDTDELHAKNMESRKMSGLFFIGEVVDVTGHLGGFNFQWAWASGAAAGRGL